MGYLQRDSESCKPSRPDKLDESVEMVVDVAIDWAKAEVSDGQCSFLVSANKDSFNAIAFYLDIAGK